MLTIVRHGRTETNAAGLLLGRADPALDDVGRAQVEAVARALGPLPPATTIVTSPLRRARETAALLSAESLEVVVDERWIELDYGDLEGQPFAEVPPEIWVRWRNDIEFVPAGGESLGALSRRVNDACASLCEQAQHGEVVVVTHVSPVKAAVAWALGVGMEISWRTFVAPASITRVAVRPDGTASLHSFNECPWDTGGR